MRIILLLFLLASLLKAAPSTDLGQEIQVPLESVDGFALIDKGTGQIRTITINTEGKVFTSTSEHSGLPSITGAKLITPDSSNSATLCWLAIFSTISSASSYFSLKLLSIAFF